MRDFVETRGHGTWARRLVLSAGVALFLAAGLPGALATDTVCTGEVRDGGNYVCTGAPGIVPDISTTGAATMTFPVRQCTIANDDCWDDIPLGANRFRWYGINYATVYVSSNGYVTFPGGYTSVPTFVPSTANPNGAAYAYGADLGFAPTFAGATVLYQSTTCGGQDCLVVQWNNAAVLNENGDETGRVTAALALVYATNTVYTRIISETDAGLGGGAAANPLVVGTENQGGTAGLWYLPGGDLNSAGATAGNEFAFSVSALPQPVTEVTVTATETTATVEVTNPGGVATGLLVLRSTGSPVTATPTNGVAYARGQVIGSAVVACVAEGAGVNACTDPDVLVNTGYYYQVFTFDATHTYSAGYPSGSLFIRPGAASIKSWTINVGATTLAPLSVTGSGADRRYVESGNDRLVYRFAGNALRSGWNPPQLAGAVQGQSVSGTLGGTPFSFMSAQNGFLYVQNLDNAADLRSENVLGDLGAECEGGGALQAGPRVNLDEFGGTGPDAILVGTRCYSGYNRIFMYAAPLSAEPTDDAPIDTYPDRLGEDADAEPLGIMNGAGIILYRSGAPNIYVQPMRRFEGPNPSAVAVLVTAGGLEPHATYEGLGDIDADAVLVRRGGAGATQLVAVGNTSGTVYVLDPINTAGLDAPEVDSFAGTPDGAIKGLSVSGPTALPDRTPVNWIVWTTDTRIHSVALAANGTFVDATYTSAIVSAPSRPLVLTGQTQGFRIGAYVGAGDGRLYQFDATNLATAPRFRLVEPGQTIGDPTFEFNDGADQAILVGATNGTIHRVLIPMP